MLRPAAFAALALLTACAPDTPQRVYGPQPNARPSLGVLVNATRGRCVWVLTGGQPERVCVPRKRRPEPRDSIGTDTMSAPAPAAR